MRCFLYLVIFISLFGTSKGKNVDKPKKYSLPISGTPPFYIMHKSGNYAIRCFKPATWISRSSNDVGDRGILYDWKMHLKELLGYTQGENEAKTKWSEAISSIRYKFLSAKDLSRKEMMLYLPPTKNIVEFPKPDNSRLKIVSTSTEKCYYVRKFRIPFRKLRNKMKLKPMDFSRIILKQLNTLKESIFDDVIYKKGEKVTSRLSTKKEFYLNMLSSKKKKPFEIMIEF